MPRRGKAATRQARQRRAQTRPSLAPPIASARSTVDSVAEPPAPTSRPSPRSERPAVVAGSSALTARARDEYHYVGRDLRNIGILAGVMLVVLLIAFVAFRALGA